MRTIKETVETEIKNWLDKNIAHEHRNGSEVAELEKTAIEKVTSICEENALRTQKFSMDNKAIIDEVNGYFTNYFYN